METRDATHGGPWVEAARGIAAGLPAQADAIEEGRRLPPGVAAALREAGLLRLCAPRSVGGPEAHPWTVVEVLEALARGDGSAAWCAMIASTTSVLAGYLDGEAAKRVFGSPDAVVGGVFAPRGRAVREPGGYRMTGRWSFASGCQHASWLLGGCLVEGDAGPELVDGRPDVRLLLFPAEQAEILDTWDVSGMRGTGSHDIAVSDLAVPGSHAVSMIGDRPRETGALYGFPVFGLLAVGIAGVGLGLARRAIDELAELATRKTPTLGRRRLADRGLTQSRVAEAEAGLGSARSWLRERVGAAFAEAEGGEALGLETRARLRLAASHAVKASIEAVDSMWRLAGGSSIYATSPLERVWRDAHVVGQHMMVAEPTLELTGRVLLGVETDTSTL